MLKRTFLSSNIIRFLMKRGSVDFTYVWTELLIKKNCGREELLLLYTANKTVEACAE